MTYPRPVTSAPGTPLLTRLARRERAALKLMRDNPVRATNRLSHVDREARAAGITPAQITAEIRRLEKGTER